jgi:hypothetical protein
VQTSRCTIHGAEIPLDELEEAEDFLVRFDIEPDAKHELSLALELFRIDRAYLYPDLTNLAETIKNTNYGSLSLE